MLINPEKIVLLTKFLSAFEYVSHEIKPIQPRFPYKPQRGAPSNIQWPPKGLHFLIHFKPPNKLNKDIKITVNYEIYDNMPFLTKWITVKSLSKQVQVGIENVEILSLNWQWANQGYEWLQIGQVNHRYFLF